jgi:hypothetical protein
MNRALAVPLLLCSILVAACAAPQDRTPSLLAEVLPALETQEGSLVRYNPVDCGCPHFELRTQGRWIRIRILEDPDRPLVDRLIKAGEELSAVGRPALFRLPLELASKSVFRCASGVPFLELEATGDWQPQAGPAVAPQPPPAP